MWHYVNAKALFVLLVLFFCALGGLYYFGTGAQMVHTDVRTQLLEIGGTAVTVEIAETPAEQELGLGGRAGLAPDHAMLFVFPKDGIYGFWMKDMRFPIDMVFITAGGTIVTIDEAVSPDSYPQSFSPTTPVRYVLELPAHWTSEHGVRVGDTVQF